VTVSAIVRPTTRRPVAKVLGSVGVLAAAAAVAGIGTFGAFTDSTAPLASQVGSGTVSIDLAAPAQVLAVPRVDGGWLPGDRSYLAVDLVNSGTSALGSVTMAISALHSSALDTDTTNGLQLTMDGCSQAWDAAGGQYACAGTVTHFYAGPIVVSGQLPRAASLTAGGVDHLLATATLPQTAGNSFMGATTDLGVVFTGTQRIGTNR
jgi:hypothetical protein